MRKLILSAIFALAALSASAQTLVVYYSRTGQNYTSDGIVNLKVGNTAVVAKQIQKLTGADIFHSSILPILIPALANALIVA